MSVFAHVLNVMEHLLRLIPVGIRVAGWLRQRRRPQATHPAAYNSRATLRRPDGLISPIPFSSVLRL